MQLFHLSFRNQRVWIENNNDLIMTEFFLLNNTLTIIRTLKDLSRSSLYLYF